jgi:hypothetical protein
MNGDMPWADISRAQLLCVAALGVLGWLALLRQLFRRWSVRHALRQRMARARQAERDAPRWLAKHGYAVLDAQLTSEYEVSLDGEPIRISVRADYIVEREGLRYVAEVKSGAAAPRIETQATRRQLLEYRFAFEVDGVLLVDAETERVHIVRFPRTESAKPASSQWFAWLWGASLIVLIAWLCARSALC